MTNPRLFLYCMTTGVFISLPAFAYVDPGSGTLILQMLAAAGVGMIFYFRQFRDKVKSIFTGRSETPDSISAEKRDNGE